MKAYPNEVLKEKISRKKTIGKIVGVCLWIPVAFVAVCMCIVFCQKVIAKRDHVSLFGCSAFAVMSGSMQPSIDVYDVIVVKKAAENDLSAGDVIAFFDSDGNIVTHRIAETSVNDGGTFYTTKGDANNANDTEPIPYDNVIGKYVFKISGGAHIMTAIASPWGIALVILLLVLIGFSIVLGIDRKTPDHSVAGSEKPNNKRESSADDNGKGE